MDDWQWLFIGFVTFGFYVNENAKVYPELTIAIILMIGIVAICRELELKRKGEKKK